MRIVLIFLLSFIAIIGYSNASELSTELSNAKADYSAGKFDSALEKFQNLADLNNSEAQFYLGEMYDRGKGVGVNYEIAKSWYSKSALAGFVDSQTALAILIYNKETEEGLRWFNIASENGDPLASGYLGYFHVSGEFKEFGLEQNFATAIELLETAVNGGDAESRSLYVLMNVLQNFDETNFDFLRNIRLLNLAIEANDWLLDDAKRLESFLEAVIAAKDGDPNSQLELAQFYNRGLTLKFDWLVPEVSIKIVRKDVTKSLFWAQEAAKGGNPDASNIISELIFFDLVSGNQIDSFENLSQAIEIDCAMDFTCSFEKVWKYMDVSGDGNLSLAEISKFQRGLVNLAYVENSEELKIEELSAVNLASILILPITSTAIINSYDYNNDGVLQKREIFGDTEFAKLVGIDTRSLATGIDFSKLGTRLNQQIEKFPFPLFK